ncbi:MAG: redox-sensing transcriptional repressor Rex [Spirochaetia bacterium]|nr:redox-sensing transcriptional repressor Rex [Spirochaetia bacterium]
MPNRKIPAPTVNRLSLYLKYFSELTSQGVEYISSGQVAEKMGLNPAQVRKDLAYFGKFGRRGFGYGVEQLKQEISKILGTHRQWRLAVIGTGNLGRALLMYQGFLSRGFKPVAGFDVDPDKVGWELDGVHIYHFDELEKVIKSQKIDIVIITTPKASLDGVMERLKGSGVKGVLNFAGKHLLEAEGIAVRNVDLAIELEQLTFSMTNKES